MLRSQRTPVVSSRKRLLFRTLALLLAYAACELVCLTALLFQGGWGRVHTDLEAAARGDGLMLGLNTSPDVVHPYLGFVRRPGPVAQTAADALPISEFGLTDTISPLQPPLENGLVIGILGGSLAQQFFDGGRQRLEDELRRCPYYRDKQFRFVNLALSGYKQPQQLMIVNYLLSLGGRFDMLINIDGYNEAVLPAVENVPHGVTASFPRSWHTRSRDVGDMAVLRLLGRISYLDHLKHRAAAAFTSSPLRHSATATLLLSLLKSSLENESGNVLNTLNRLLREGNSFVATGPAQQFADDGEMYAHCADVWRNSSLQIHQLCKANGIRYYHFLQPNQYLPDSKPMQHDERAIAFDPHHPGKKHVERCYPLLLREGEELTRAGVRFHSLADLFQTRPEPTYRDQCCHLNPHGDELLADAIARAIRTDAPSWARCD